MTERTEAVKAHFENTEYYLKYDYNLRIRAETVDGFTAGWQISKLLDVPCGNGAVSIPLLVRTGEATLIDISENMVALARQNIPTEFRQATTFIHGDLFWLELPENSYDLVICLGIMAHVNAPADLLEKIARLVRPGGSVIIQNTDSDHFYASLIRLYLGLKRLFGKEKYRLNKVSGKWLENALGSKGFELVNVFRYNQSFLGFSRLFGNQAKYRITRKLFGSHDHNRNAPLGSDVIYHFKKTG